jgi:5-methyltetrahydropteroyltriglutamate--homocysteine methyltransferase
MGTLRALLEMIHRMKTCAYGYPRLGKNREYKRSIEAFWKGELSQEDLENHLDLLQRDMLTAYSGRVDEYPVGEMTAYDQMLDTAIMIGLYEPGNLSGYYELCRGKRPLKMTKWFNTNYHYLVPDFSGSRPDSLRLSWNRPAECRKKFSTGIPYLVGPFTFLKLSKGISKPKFPAYALRLADIFRSALSGLAQVHIDEPAFVLELTPEEVSLLAPIYRTIGESGAKISLFTYYDSVDFYGKLCDLPVASLGLDFVHGEENFRYVESEGFPDDKTLIAGLIDGRNVWRTDTGKALDRLDRLSRYVKHLAVSNAAPLSHIPITLAGEKIDSRIKAHLAFADEKLEEISTIARVFSGEEPSPAEPPRDFGVTEGVEERIANLEERDFRRPVPSEERKSLQDRVLKLPLLPTTTIGSFPQTPDLRKRRAELSAGEVQQCEYERFVREKIREVIGFQQELGLDILVHGEFERSDMVEFFAQKLEGITTTKNGWIISYGTRVYRPPLLYGDVSRPDPLTVKEISYAQSLTGKPVKGMLTGPVTITAWSFVRDDIPLAEVAFQIALALRDEIADLERAGIRVIQVDEPAFREMAPNKRRKWDAYFEWATKAFRLATAGAMAGTQIHSHMCYSEFGEIIERILALDVDVISIEATRSKGNVLESFEKVRFDRKIGLGVWDVHSPRIPEEAEIEKIIRRALKVIPKENFWINPDCGLKTRNWEEVKVSLSVMVAAARRVRDDEHLLAQKGMGR